MTRFVQSHNGDCGLNPPGLALFSPTNRTKAHEPIEFVHLRALWCSCARLRAPKSKNREMVHKPHIQTACTNLQQLAAACTNLQKNFGYHGIPGKKALMDAVRSWRISQCRRILTNYE